MEPISSKKSIFEVMTDTHSHIVTHFNSTFKLGPSGRMGGVKTPYCNHNDLSHPDRLENNLSPTLTGLVVDLFHSPTSAMIVASIGMCAAGFVCHLSHYWLHLHHCQHFHYFIIVIIVIFATITLVAIIVKIIIILIDNIYKNY